MAELFDKMDFKEFDKKYGEEIMIAGLNPERFYEVYYERVYPHIDLIAEFRGREEFVRLEVLQNVLHVGTRYFKKMREIFPELELAINSKQGYMALKAQMDLNKAIELSPTNAKLIEMQLRRWDEGYNDKGEVDINLPTTLDVKFRDAELSEEEIEDKIKQDK